MTSVLTWIDQHPRDWRSRLCNQLLPATVCSVLLAFFIWATVFCITYFINPHSTQPIQIVWHPFDVAVGVFLYFVTAVDYALIIGRMQVVNTGIRARFVMNAGTCLGCFVGVTLVLFLWGLAKEVDWLIIALLIFAGCVMAKLAYEGLEYFADSRAIWSPLRFLTIKLTTWLHRATEGLTFWIPELASPKVRRLSLAKLAGWSFILPFIIGLDDFVGYMGAMTIYNVFSLLTGIFIADILIDILIFLSPRLTRKLVESAGLSFLATYAFLYLMYKSLSEAIVIAQRTTDATFHTIYLVGGVCLSLYLVGRWVHQHHLAKFRV